VVDIIAQDDKELTVYQKSFSEYKKLFRQLQELKESIERDKTNADFLQFQYDELSAVNLKSGEQEELEQRADTMSHAK
jgi:DNA repair protein RecN (Recombination protein N)